MFMYNYSNDGAKVGIYLERICKNDGIFIPFSKKEACLAVGLLLYTIGWRIIKSDILSIKTLTRDRGAIPYFCTIK